ncbi:MAG: glycosyltransferase [Hyphomonas sp.]|nr:glycosyltransferase [Hyphomonas sp.]MCB9960908.1 glycosyltransferase [Hyphomonas sp.]MCB9970199.1 glycosyltransferase [Hyphomonas sp.]
MVEADVRGMSIAVLLPCYNEEKSIAGVVTGFRAALPGARIYVYDNNSSDDTSGEAARAGAVVIPSRRQGKGNVVRQMFADIEADVYLMADGDGTYDPSAAPDLIRKLLEDRCDMVVGTRRNVRQDAGRNGHAFGNRLFNRVYRTLFGNDFSDILSGYRAFSRRYAKSFPASSPGFEIETEMSVHASMLRLPVSEIEFDYGRRAEGSVSKLSTFRDGWRIMRMMGLLMKETKPFAFFGMISLALFAACVAFAVPVLAEYLDTGLVTRYPTWIFSMTLLLAAMMTFIAGVILDSLARARIEQKRIHYLSIPAARGERVQLGTEPLQERRSGRPGSPAYRERA